MLLKDSLFGATIILLVISVIKYDEVFKTEVRYISNVNGVGFFFEDDHTVLRNIFITII